MYDTPQTQPDETTPASAGSGDEARIFHDIIRKIDHLPEGVWRVGFRVGEDSSGAPAVWFTFVARDDLKPSKQKIADLQRIANAVRWEVIRSSSDRWPYVEIATE
jgi:hypothetical protein